jgi:hypothetical protein
MGECISPPSAVAGRSMPDDDARTTTGREVFASFPDLKEQAADALRVEAEPL